MRRVTIYTFGLFFTFASCFCASGVYGSKDELVENVVDMCGRFRQLFLPTSFSLTIEEREKRDGPMAKKVTSFKFRGHDFFLLDTESNKTDSKASIREVVSQNDKYNFSIKNENNEERGWSIASLNEGKNVDGSAVISVNSRERFYPIKINHLYLDELLKCPSMSIKSYQEKVDTEGITHVNVVLTFNPEERIDNLLVMFKEISLGFIPKKYEWIPYSFVATGMHGDSLEFYYTGFRSACGFTIPSELEIFYRKDVNSDRWQRTKCTYEFSDETVPKEEFFLSHYGLPEPDFGEQRTNRFRYILMTIGSLMIIIALWQMYQNRKENKA